MEPQNHFAKMTQPEAPPPFSSIPYDPIDQLRVWRGVERLTADQLKGLRVLVRPDLNVPMENATIKDPARAKAALATINHITQNGGVAVVASHLGRPLGQFKAEFSLKPLASWFEKALKQKVTFIPEGASGTAEKHITKAANGSVILLENLRFHKGEEAGDLGFAKRLALGCDLYVNDAFSVAHRNHASIALMPKLLPPYAGFQMAQELTALEGSLDDPERPALGICGGAKITDKLDTLVYFVRRMDYLLVGGAMANTIMALCGMNVGGSVYEHTARQAVLRVIRTAIAAQCEVVLPIDGAVATVDKNGKIATAKQPLTKELRDITPEEQIFDIGPKSVQQFAKYIKKAKTILWNGPLGYFEKPPFNQGTDAVAELVAAKTSPKCLTVAGGGDTAFALGKYANQLSHVSLAGGAFLSWFSDVPLAGVQALKVWAPDSGPFSDPKHFQPDPPNEKPNP